MFKEWGNSLFFYHISLKIFFSSSENLINNRVSRMIRHIHDVDINNVHYKVIDTDLDSYKNVENLIKAYGHHYQFQPLIITTQLSNTYSNPYFNTFVLSREYSYNDALKLAYNDYCSAIFKNLIDNDTGIRH